MARSYDGQRRRAREASRWKRRVVDLGCWNVFRARIAAACTALPRRAGIWMLQEVMQPKGKDLYIDSGYVAWLDMAERVATPSAVMRREDIAKDWGAEM